LPPPTPAQKAGLHVRETSLWSFQPLISLEPFLFSCLKKSQGRQNTKILIVFAVSIVLVSILFCPMVMAAPLMPEDVQIVQPDPSLAKELSAFFGKWEGASRLGFYIIVEKIDEKKASLYVWRSICGESMAPCWTRYEAQVIKEGRRYKLQFRSRFGNVELTLKGENLKYSGGDSMEPDTQLKRF